MTPVYCKFSDGIYDGMAGRRVGERISFWLLALLHPSVYRMGTANGNSCVWWKRTTPTVTADTEAK